MFLIIKKYNEKLSKICKNEEKGVTLISLIIIIIILIILATIAIRSSFGNKGIIKNARKSVKIYENTSLNELKMLNELDGQLKTYVDKPKATTIRFTADVTDWTNGDVTVTAQTIDIGFEIELKSEVSDWNVRENNAITVTSNQQISARLKNKEGKYSEDIATYNVTNIDKEGPTTTAPTAISTTNSITVTNKQTDNESGIASIQYQIKKNGTSTWGSLQSGATFGGLTQNTKYDVRTHAVDKAGNASDSAVTTVTTDTIPTPVRDSNLTFTPTPSAWTNGNVSVAVSTTIKGYTLQTSTDGKTWGTTNPLIYSANGTAYARLWDGNNASAVATTNITNIDKLAPTNTAPTVATTTNKITATLKQVDQNAGSGSGKSDLNASKTQYRLVTDTNGTTAVTGKDWQSSNVFSGLTQNTTYYVQTKVTDNAGNTTTSAVATAKTGTIPKLVPETPVGTKVGTTVVDGQTLDWYLFDTDATAGKAYLVSTPTYWVPDTTKEVSGAYPPKLVSSADSNTKALRQAIQKLANGTNSYHQSSVTYTPSENTLSYFKSVNSQWSANRGSVDFKSLKENEQAACYLADADIFAGIKNQVNKADGNLKGKIQTLVGGASIEQWCKAYNNQAEVINDTTKQITCEYQETNTPGYIYKVNGTAQNSGWYTNNKTIVGNDIYGAADTNKPNNESNPFYYWWWLASPSAYRSNYVCIVDGGDSNLYYGDSTNSDPRFSLFASVALDSFSNLTFTATPTTKTSGNVTVTVSTTVTGYTLQTSTDGTTWGTTNPLIFSQNGTAYARLWDGNNASAVATFNVTNIETDPLKNTDRTIDDLNADGGDSNKDGVVDTKDDLRGFYIDLNNDGKLDTTNDGVIYGDLLTGGEGLYFCHTLEGIDTIDDDCKYKIPTKSTLSSYEIIKDSNGKIKKFDGPFGSRGMLQRKTAVTNGDRFYVLALADFDSNIHCWYNKATNMTDYATYTSTSFGSGKENTSKMITAWNNKKYGEQNDYDVWGVIQDKAKAGWFVPSRDEWNAFGAFFKVGGEVSSVFGAEPDDKDTFTDYYDYNKVYKLSNWCWSSSQYNSNNAYFVGFNFRLFRPPLRSQQLHGSSRLDFLSM